MCGQAERIHRKCLRAAREAGGEASVPPVFRHRVAIPMLIAVSPVIAGLSAGCGARGGSFRVKSVKSVKRRSIFLGRWEGLGRVVYRIGKGGEVAGSPSGAAGSLSPRARIPARSTRIGPLSSVSPYLVEKLTLSKA